MKIKTITCHNVYNHGAALQEFALISYLKSQGHDVSTINYQPPYLADNYRILGVPSSKWKTNILKRGIYILSKLPKHFGNRKRYKAFDNFSKTYIPETSQVFTNNKELKNYQFDDEAFICGSDQIWNTLFENGRDPAFYLDFVPQDRLRISYAASFATESIYDGYENFVKEKITNIDYVSVRESSGIEILNQLGIQGCTRVLDPVFLLDRDYWRSTFIESTKLNENYILIYDFDSNEKLKSFAIKQAREHGYKIFALNKNITFADRVYWDCGPEKFLSLMNNAQLVLCNSFHAVAFSLIFQRQFVVYNRNIGINTRMKDLLDTLDLSDRMSDLYTDNFIDYTIVNSKIEKLKNQSKDFLKNSLLNN